MLHPDIAQAVAQAHRDDLLRAARGCGPVVRHDRRRDRLTEWLDAQLRRRRTNVAPAQYPHAGCVAVTR